MPFSKMASSIALLNRVLCKEGAELRKFQRSSQPRRHRCCPWPLLPEVPEGPRPGGCRKQDLELAESRVQETTLTDQF